jgi:hypothetical protein
MPANVETYSEDNRWKNRVLGNKRASNTFDTKAEAQAKGREMAQKLRSEHIIKKRDGTIGARNSYGNDPHPPKG